MRLALWHYGIVGKVTACDTGIPFGYQLMSLLLHYQSSSLLMFLRKKQKIPGVWSPDTRMDNWEQLLTPTFDTALRGNSRSSK